MRTDANQESGKCAKEHFETEQQIKRHMGKFELREALSVMDKRDASAKRLKAMGWSAYEIGANALGLAVSHFRELVAAGIYVLGLGMAGETWCEFSEDGQE